MGIGVPGAIAAKIAFPDCTAVTVTRDEPVLAVVPDQNHDRRADPERRFDFLGVHQKAGITGHRDRLPIGERQLRRDGTRHANSENMKLTEKLGQLVCPI